MSVQDKLLLEQYKLDQKLLERLSWSGMSKFVVTEPTCKLFPNIGLGHYERI